MSYDHKKIAKKWARAWEKNKKLYAADDKSKKPKRYVLDMFPYPSGEGLHVGHTEGEVATDIYSRFLRMQGYNVLHPMGWDAFGLPAENYAIKHKIHPAKTVKKNTANFKKQMGMVGLGFDWAREINTTDPKYYRWTQWIFLKLFEHGLAYEAEVPINFCPSCKTALANEEVINGACERCGTAVERRNLRQWMLKITAYAERLLKDLDGLEWSEQLKAMQRNWIGRSEGGEISFPLHHEKQNKVLFALINDKREVLIEQKKGGTFSGKWLFPGGKIEKEDVDMVAAATREIREETLLTDKDFEYVGFLGYFHPTHEHENMPLLVFRLKKGKRVKSSGEHEWKWQSIEDMPDEPGHCAFEDMFGKVRSYCEEGSILPSAITVFTTRADTLFGATYAVLAPEHSLLEGNHLGIENYPEVAAYVTTAKNKSDLERTAEVKEKTGVRLEGVQVINPATGKAIPLFVADYVLGGYGTGAVMAVPAHDERDFDFAKKFELPIHHVVHSSGPSSVESAVDHMSGPYCDEGVLEDSGEFSGERSEDARIKIAARYGKKTVKYKLRDWIFSRQRYWGEPFPLVFCERCKAEPKSAKLRKLSKGEQLNPGWIAVSEKHLPVQLPNVKSYEPSGTGESPLAKMNSWVKTKCPRCKGPAKRETNTMPQWAGSCWYYLRFMDPKNTKALVDKKKEKYWSPVDVYVGGAEHAVLHLLYARFWHKFLYDIGIVSKKEPFHKLINQGLIFGPDKQKMSKSRGNVVNPIEVVDQHGADVMRMYEMFMGPLEDAKPWDTQGIAGIVRFLERVHKIVHGVTRVKKGAVSVNPELVRSLHKTIKKVTEDIEHFQFNTAISALMILVNDIEKYGGADKAVCETLVLLCAPFAPFLAEEMWAMLGKKGSVHAQVWLKYDKKLTVEDMFDLVVQINGKVRDVLRVQKGITEAEALRHASASDKVKKFLDGAEIKKKIFIHDRLLNIII